MDLSAYHRGRDVAHQSFRSACYAPFVGMSFDMSGAVSVCAFTRTTPLGQIGQEPLLDMWRGHVVDELRSAVVNDDLMHSCSRCAEEIAGGNESGVFSTSFDRFRAERDQPWPSRMEFALSNACNLQCVMCSGEFSSAIRSQREGLPALPARYDESFVDELGSFLPHLEQARFLGGEPFLSEINFLIWERMIELGLQVECNVTTNGTQWSKRVERVLEALPFSVGISLDGVAPDTMESIRVGVDHERVVANLHRFVEYRDRTDSSLSLTYCLMTLNVEEFVEFIRWAEGLGCNVFVNTVRQPPEFSLYLLPADELMEIIRMLEHQRNTAAPSIPMNLHVLDGQIERLRSHHRSVVERNPAAVGLMEWTSSGSDLLDALSEVSESEVRLLERLRSVACDGEVDVVRCDDQERIRVGDGYAGVDVHRIIGQPASVLMPALASLEGTRIDVVAATAGQGMSARVLAFSDGRAAATVVVSITRRGPEPWGTSRYAAVLERSPREETAVHLLRRRGAS
jgi:MoaA/NifB/PqqE/SkfB family radical SAM enzyme